MNLINIASNLAGTEQLQPLQVFDYHSTTFVFSDANYTCQSPNYKCEASSIHVCLKPKQLCDGNFDCDDKSDEGDLCNSKYLIYPKCPDQKLRADFVDSDQSAIRSTLIRDCTVCNSDHTFWTTPC